MLVNFLSDYSKPKNILSIILKQLFNYIQLLVIRVGMGRVYRNESVIADKNSTVMIVIIIVIVMINDNRKVENTNSGCPSRCCPQALSSFGSVEDAAVGAKIEVFSCGLQHFGSIFHLSRGVEKLLGLFSGGAHGLYGGLSVVQIFHMIQAGLRHLSGALRAAVFKRFDLETAKKSDENHGKKG